MRCRGRETKDGKIVTEKWEGNIKGVGERSGRKHACFGEVKLKSDRLQPPPLSRDSQGPCLNQWQVPDRLDEVIGSN